MATRRANPSLIDRLGPLGSPSTGFNDPPPPYGPEYLERARRAALAGFTTYELSRLLGVTVDTINLWDMVYSEFAAAIRVGAQSRNARVEAAFYQRAVGYEHPSEQLIKISQSEKIGDEWVRTEEIIHEPIVKHIPADPKAALDWLMQHDPDRYKMRREEPAPSVMRIVIEGGLPSEEARAAMEREPTTEEMAARINADDD